MGMFRKLKASEIDCRISTISKKGLSLLLYKDARVDQNILDETVGAFNWQKSYSRDNANCVVSLWDETKKQWVSKEDTGTESFTEKEKGLASDSFKRACFNWGIGRELYSAPFIWVNADDCTIEPKGDKFACYDRFEVKKIGYNDEGNISELTIVNRSNNRVVFKMGDTIGKAEEEPKPSDTISPQQKVQILHELNRTRIPQEQVFQRYGVKTLDDIPASKFEKLIGQLKAVADYTE